MTQLLEIAPLRQASRAVVRELGMLQDTFAPAAVTHTQCHALIELNAAGTLSVSELADRLRLDKSVASRTASQLQERRLVSIRGTRDDKRQKRLQLTKSGERLVQRIHQAADARVEEALRMLSPEQRGAVVQGMACYARALTRARLQSQTEIRPIVPEDDPAVTRIIRTVMTEHGAVGSGFAIIDPEVTCMSGAYDPRAKPPAGYFVLADDGRILGGAGFGPLTDGEPGVCELRKMYLLPEARGAGHGRRLLRHVLVAAKQAGYPRCYLETMATMHRARALYASFGFTPLPGPMGATGHYGCDAWYCLDLDAAMLEP